MRKDMKGDERYTSKLSHGLNNYRKNEILIGKTMKGFIIFMVIGYVAFNIW